KIEFGANNTLSVVVIHSGLLIYDMVFVNGNIFIGQNNNIFRLIKNNNREFSKINSGEKLLNLSGDINKLFYDNGLLWIGSAHGLYRYDMSTENITRYVHNPVISTSISSNSITDIKKNKEGNLIIATLIGINFYDYQTNSFTRVNTETSPADQSLNNNFVSFVHCDNDLIWVATEKGGINLLIPNQNFFTNVTNIPEEKGSLSKNPVNAIYEDEAGDLLVGTVEGGLNIRKKSTENFIHSTSTYNNPSTLSHNTVSSICQDFNGDYWIGTWGMGVNLLKKENKYNPVFKRFTSLDNSENAIGNNFVAAIISDSIHKGLWIGTRSGLDFYEINTGRFYQVLNYLPDNKGIWFVTGLYIDSQQRLWVGTGNGLFCIYLNQTDLNQNKIRYRHFHYILTDPESTIVEKINCIIESKDGKIWFGSNGNGLYSYHKKDGKEIFKKYDEKRGLLDNVIYGVLEDESGTLWLSTDKGLCAFNPIRKSIRNFTLVDGLISNQFYWDAYFKSSDGRMYFGHMNGFTVFNPLKYTPNTIKNSVAISSISVLTENIFPAEVSNSDNYLKFKDFKLNKLVLKENDKAFTVEFSALNYNLPDKIKYAYRLKGFDIGWKEVTSDRRFANFTNIKNGNYELELKCTNADGTWSDQITSLKIRVIPPFYKAWWFILLSIAFVGYVLFRYYKYRINSLREQENHLRQLVEIRTREIEQQKEKLQNQAVKLQSNMEELIEHQEEVSRQNEQLILKNQKITHQKEKLEQLSKKLEEATIDKIAFFTNITHEFRTPITLILGPVERSLKLSTNPKVLEQLHIVKRNSKLLLSLINQLMDFRKVESGKMEVTKTQQNFVEFLDDIILPFEDLAKDRGITFIKRFRINPPEFLFDRDNMQKVIGNLLSNAIKFTPDHGFISVIAATYYDKKNPEEKLYLAVKDTGKGIPEDELERIFERFYQSKQNVVYSSSGQNGTGIGLYLCKQIIELHNGKIEVLNQQTGGSCFRFIIPIERRLSTLVSVDGKPMEMIVANEIETNEEFNEETTKNKPLLLIVEDNADMRQYIRSILSAEFKVLEAPNGVIGLEVTNRYQPDMIISDIMMPEMDGVEFCKRVKSNFATSHIPVVFLTAKTSTDTQIESFHQGADAFLVKPFNEELLMAIIRNLTDKRKRLQISFAESMDTEMLNFNDESLDKKFMDKALNVIKENYTNPEFDVTQFIDSMGISRSLLHKKLTNLAGQSASRFIRIFRLNIARELIIKNRVTHSLNISEIAYEVGFNDPKYFTRCFTKHFGIQPSTFMEMDK
ncbi:MAG TPA: response regulator, partial [Paludibacter sp.]|nr:response regulator [Paludibacter sp.]